IKKIARIELVIPEIFKEAAVNFVASGAGDGIQHAARAAPVFGAVIDAEDLHLQDRVRAQLHSGGAARKLVLRVHDVSAVEQKIVRLRAPSGNRQASPAYAARRRAGRWVAHSGL